MVKQGDLDEELSVLYHALRATRRRYVITIMKGTGGRTFTTRELAKKTASHEESIPERHATGEPYHNAYNALSQTHLPTLSDAGIIIYDPQRQTVQSGADFDLVALMIDTNTRTVTVFSSLIRGDDIAEKN